MQKQHKKVKVNYEKSLEKRFKDMAKKIQEDLEADKLKYTINIDNKNVDILEELSSSVILLDLGRQFNFMESCMDIIELSDLDNFTYSKNPMDDSKYTIMRATNNADYLHAKLMAYKMLKTKNAKCGLFLSLIIFKALEAINNKTDICMEYGIDSCIVATVLYWAQQNELSQTFKQVGDKEYFPIESFNDGVSYKEILEKYNETFADTYYEYKIGNIDSERFTELLVTENGKLPSLDDSWMITSPEYSWQVVENIVGKCKLQEMDYSDEVKEAINQILQGFYYSLHSNMSGFYNVILYGCFFRKHRESIEMQYKNVEYYKKLSATNETKFKELKSQLKSKDRDLSIKDERIRILEAQLAKSKRQLDEIKNKGVKDTKPFTDKIDEQSNSINELTTKLDEASRQLTKKDSIINTLQDTLDFNKGQITVLQESKEALAEKCSEMTLTHTDEQIPIDCIVNSIRNYNIVIFGGDMMHATLKNMNFKNMRLIKARDRATDNKELRQADVIVLVTGYVSHAGCSTPKNAAEIYGIPLIYFNNKSANMLCRELFSFFYSNEYLDSKKNEQLNAIAE